MAAMTPMALPVSAALPELRAALRAGRSAVLVAPPGAGKTTQVPLELLSEEWLNGSRILLLEPRRLAARAAAARMASLRREAVGGSVGYRIRGETRIGSDTRIEVITEGVLLRMLQSDPTLDGIGLVIFDEFHERSLNADLGLALTLASRRLFRDDLRLLVMSATLAAEPVAALMGDAAIVTAEGREYPVSTHYLGRTPDDPVAETLSTARRVLAEGEGDVLVFLPGAGEIRRVSRGLGVGLPDTVDVYPLFGGLSGADQDAAIAPSAHGRRKVVLATAIAQTSLTIEGVTAVVDSGLMRVPKFDPASGMTRLRTQQVTRDVADQRRGRAGRVAPGRCYRMWTEGRDRGLLPAQRPEILEADLAPLVLQLAAWGAGPDELDWMDPPPAAALDQAHGLLVRLDALDGRGAVTGHGRAMAELGAPPRLAHMLLQARGRRLGGLACDIAALLMNRDLLRASGRAADSDLRLRLELMHRARRTGGRADGLVGHTASHGALRRALADSRQWRRQLGVREREAVDTIESAGEILALAYPDRLGLRRRNADGAGARFLLRNGRGATLPSADSLARSEWLVVAELDDRAGDARIFRAAPIVREVVEANFGHQIETLDEVAWSSDAGRVEAASVRRLDALVLERTPTREPDRGRVTAALLQGLREAGLGALPWSRSTRQLQQRLQFMHEADAEHWPDVSDVALEATLETWLGPFIGSADRLSGLQRLDLTQALWTLVGWQRREALDELVPTHLEVPSGSRVPLDYSDPSAPKLSVRLQEVFGWQDNPRIAGGRVVVVVELLSPAHRPVQITSDLASFWQAGYFDVKKDLKGRYPKHYWPDDPATARATRRLRPPTGDA